jgi:hypothetical protein
MALCIVRVLFWQPSLNTLTGKSIQDGCLESCAIKRKGHTNRQSPLAIYTEGAHQPAVFYCNLYGRGTPTGGLLLQFIRKGHTNRQSPIAIYTEGAHEPTVSSYNCKQLFRQGLPRLRGWKTWARGILPAGSLLAIADSPQTSISTTFFDSLFFFFPPGY